MYGNTNYEICGLSNNKFTSLNPSLISRVRSLLLTTILERVYLPKYILFILDDELAKLLMLKPYYGFSEAVGKLLSHLMSECSKLLEAQRDFLPKKAIAENKTQIFWIEAPLHKNFSNNTLRQKLNKSTASMYAFYKDMHSLALKKGWDYSDNSLYDYESRRYTAAGLAGYWAAMDKTLRYIDTIYIKKLQRKEARVNMQTSGMDKYHWNREQQQQQQLQQDNQRKLPMPPY